MNFYDLLRAIQRQVQQIENIASQQDFIRRIVADHLYAASTNDFTFN